MEIFIEAFNQHRFWILPVLSAVVAWMVGSQVREMLAEAAALCRRPGTRRSAAAPGPKPGRARETLLMAGRIPAGTGLLAGEEASWIP
ncbi:MAG: hypothetical protein KKA60_06275 [Proteobacteria bacterium]|nr:hypothetical protein [Pseudomonadota bacterium]